MAKILSRYHIYQATSRLMVAPKLARPLTVTNFKNEGAVTASTVRGFSTATSDQIQMKDSFAPSVGNPGLDLFLNIFKPYAYKGEDQTERREISEVAGKSRFAGNASFPHQVICYANHLHSGQVAGLRWNTMVEDLCLKQGQFSNCLSGPVKVFTRGIHQDVKLRKQQKGRMKGISSRGDHICFGTYALQALGRARISSKTLEAGRKMLKWGAGKGGKIWVRVFPDQSTTVRPIGTRMGRGKGSLGPPQDRVAIVKPGRIIYELSGVTEETAKRAILKGGHKMPVRTQFKLSTTSLKVPLQEMRCLWQSKKRRKVQTEEMLSELYGPTLQFMVSLIADDYLVPTSEDCKGDLMGLAVGNGGGVL